MSEPAQSITPQTDQTSQSFWVVAPFFPPTQADPLIGGFINNPARLWTRVAALGHRVTVFTYGRAKGDWNFEGVRVISVGPLPFKGAASLLALEVKLLTAFLREGISSTKTLAQIRVHHAGGLSLLVLRKLRLLAAPLVVTAHGTSLPEEAANRQAQNAAPPSLPVRVSRWLQYRFDRLLFKGADALVSPSRFQVQELVALYRVAPSKITVIPNGYDEQRFRRDEDAAVRLREKLGIAPDVPLILTVARATPKKGLNTFIEAARLSEDQCNARFVAVIGDPLHRRAEIDIEALIRFAPANCTILRNVPEDELPAFYSAATICVFPSIGYESVPSVIYEACACGAPILTTRLPGIEEVIDGPFLDTADAASLAARIRDLLPQPPPPTFTRDFSLAALIPVQLSVMSKSAPKPAKPKLLFIVNVDWFFLSHRLPIALEAMRQGYDVHLACATTNKYDAILDHGIALHPLLMVRGTASPFATLISFLDILHLLWAERPDIVHLVTIKPVLLGGLAARIVRIRGVVAAVTGLGFVFVARGFWAELRRFSALAFYRLALGGSRTYAIFQNPDDRSSVMQATGLPAKRCFTIRGSGVDLSYYAALPEPAGPPVIILVARLLKDKGICEFVAAARSLKNKWEDVRFCLVGTTDPDNPASLTDGQILRWVQEGFIESWGHRDNIAQIMASAHLVVLPSYREGLPKVLLEAAACGRAVITTDVSGCRDAITPNETGLLVPARDPEALATAIDSLLGNPERRREMGRAGRALAESAFSIEDVVRRHMEIYADVLKGMS